MTGLVFVRHGTEPPAGATDRRVVLLDETSTSRAAADPAAMPIHEVLGTALAAADAQRRSLANVDEWADAARIVDRLTIDDVAWWYRIREAMVGWVHERLVWRAILAELAPGGATSVHAPETELALVDVARAFGATVTTDADERPVGPASAAAARPANGLRSRFRGVVRGRAPSSPAEPGPPAPPTTALDLRARIDRLRAGGSIMVLTHAGIQEWVDDADGIRRLVDPLVGPVIERLRATGDRPVVIGMGLDHRDAAHAAAIKADEDLLPASLLMTEWAAQEDRDTTGVEAAVARLGSARSPFIVDGIDLTEALAAEIERQLRTVVATSIRQVPRVSRLLANLGPRAIILTHEGIRTPWLIAARQARIPVHAIQHGVLYPTHPGYRHPRSAAWPLPQTTFVFGRYERSVLLEVGGYLPEEVTVSGSPRVDETREVAAPGERSGVRDELGVRQGDRLVVVSTTFSPLGRRYLLHALREVLGGPLPGIHLVFKQHPGETDDGPYRALIEGMAAAGGWEVPPMSVVRSRDLYRLLRAADAHLGYQSTVLTDAVVAGTPNLIADVAPGFDLLGYVVAGVARPVRSPAELVDAATAAAPIDPAARAVFLAEHLEPGDAVDRILERVRERSAPAPSAV
jgi:hypothetical protein